MTSTPIPRITIIGSAATQTSSTYVTDKLTPTFKKRAEARGFVLLNWGHGGWTQIFTKKPVQTIADMQILAELARTTDVSRLTDG